MAKIPQKFDLLTWSIQNFVRKVKQCVRKYIIEENQFSFKKISFAR